MRATNDLTYGSKFYPKYEVNILNKLFKIFNKCFYLFLFLLNNFFFQREVEGVGEIITICHQI